MAATRNSHRSKGKTMNNETRPQDRPYRKQKSAGRAVTVKLEAELLDALEIVREDLTRRNIADTVHVLLKWATWAHSTGRDPFQEMRQGEPGGFADWNSRIRAKREARELEQLYKLDQDGAQ
jgi:hypothetical protein